MLFEKFAQIVQNKVKEYHNEDVSTVIIKDVIICMMPYFRNVLHGIESSGGDLELYINNNPDFYRASRYLHHKMIFDAGQAASYGEYFNAPAPELPEITSEMLDSAMDRVNFMYAELASICENGLHEAYADINEYFPDFWSHLSGIRQERDLQMKLFDEDPRFEPMANAVLKRFGVLISIQKHQEL
ncbi:hypothetical protein [Sulfuricurvum sp.]|uniref:hypothetical protein n=1 Tax=Sulfuricurvum sp. TaxID=2025608 RepID=UPI002617CA5F|nr:hypothetical protein [Sulfuricurvum sp.]MDD3596985.1 hypothetical protein [Sulfuricurvum sp.]